jgi:cytosine/adenosine deaminase-related metal-dependent hydrolase
MAIVSRLPIEVELVFDVMPCLAMRRSYDSAETAHPCGYFAEWGFYHTYDYASAGPPGSPTIDQPVVYGGKRPVAPELLSGCRKAPILCVGINPNLPGWTSRTRNAIHPHFDDALQYAHYFRYRTRDKREIPDAAYDALLGAGTDAPQSAKPLTGPGQPVAAEASRVLMYQQYQSLLDRLAVRQNWQGHKLAVGEDIAYANMVACPSTRWVVSPNDEDPAMPAMGSARARGIVGECFFKRRYFLRQLVQSLPAVIIVFSRTTAREFIAALEGRFSVGDPRPNEPLAALFAREIRLLYGTLSDGTRLDARVIFMPHASASAAQFGQLREPCVDRLIEEIDGGNMAFNQATGHLRRGRGACVFCTNDLYSIGACDYEAELSPLAPGVVSPLAASRDAAAAQAAALEDKQEQLRLLDQIAPPPASTPLVQPMARAAAVPPPLALRGTVVPMSGPPMKNATVYVRNGRIAAVQPANAPPPAGFESVPVTGTLGVIYPGLLDLHNHLAYNILPLWKPPRRFDNRGQWQRRAEYRRDVTEPMKVLASAGQGIIKAIIRYIEVKLLLGGVTSGQGMRSSFGGNQFYRGLVRNFEVPDDPALVQAGSRVLDLVQEDVPQMRGSLDSGAPFFFHLAEGIDPVARQQYALLEANQLLRANLLCIHSLALREDQHRTMAEVGTGVVWSPLSNSLLYGQTIDPAVLKRTGALIGLGSDWTPSGSRNMLQELKVAWLTSRASSDPFSTEALVRAVTIDSATRAGWHSQLGSIEPGKLADLLIVDAKHDDPFENLLRTTEREVRLVMIGGRPRYGQRSLLERLGLPAGSLERVVVAGRGKRLDLAQEGSPLAGLSFAAARQRLGEAMADLDRLRNAPGPLFPALAGGPLLELELDMQADEFELMRAAAALPPLKSLTLDPPTIIDDDGYFDALEAIAHLPAALKGPDGLRGFYR